jgi:hypothetical protein
VRRSPSGLSSLVAKHSFCFILFVVNVTSTRFFLQIACLLLALSCWPFVAACAQGGATTDAIQVRFLKESLSVQPGTFGFNSFVLTNTSLISQKLSLRVENDRSWQLLHSIPASFVLAPGQSETFSLRVSPLPGISSQGKYQIKIRLNSMDSNWESVHSFGMEVKSISRWNAQLTSSEVYVREDSVATAFGIKFENKGNQTESLVFNLRSSLQLNLSSGTNRIKLEPGKDTLVQVTVKSRPEELRRNRETEISIHVRGDKEDEEITLTQKIISTPWYVREHRSKWLTIPFVVEGNILNANSPGQRMLWGSVQGQVLLNNNRSIDVLYRSDSYTSDLKINNTIRQLTYSTPKFKVNVGTQIDFVNIQVNGEGIGLEYNPRENSSHSLRVVKSSVSNAHQVIYTSDQQLSSALMYSSRTMVNLDNQIKSNSVFTFNKVKWSKDPYTALSVELGNSYERFNLMSATYWGASLAYRLAISREKYSIVSSYTYASAYFPGILRGLRSGAHELRYRPGPHFLSLYATSNSQHPAQINLQENALVPRFQYHNSEWGMKAGKAWGEVFSLTVSGSFQKLMQESLRVNVVKGWGGSITTTLNPSQSFDATFTANWRKSGIYSLSDQYPTASLFGQLRYKGIGATIRMMDGPMFYMDYLSLKEGGMKPRLIQASAFGEWSTKNKNLQTRYQMTYNESSTISGSVIHRGDFIWNLPAHRVSLILSGMSNQYSELARVPLVNLTFRKTFDVPLPMVQKYGSLKVVLYKDLNHNNTLDATDERIGQTLLTVNKKRFRTNANGGIYLKNVVPGEYIVDLSKIQTLRGWAPKAGLTQSVMVSHDAYLAIPFSKSRYVSGRLTVEKDAYSMNTTTLDGVRITALGSKGDTYYAITNLEGAFFFNLAPDEYIIQVKEDVMGSEYRIAESSQKVDLNDREAYEVEFKATQRKRQINIRKK